MKTLPTPQIASTLLLIILLLFSVGVNAQQVELGVATWLDDNSEQSTNQFYALHKYAPIGTIIRVRNAMNNRTANVKVIGKLSDNQENKGVVIKVSGAVARYLDVLDEKFRVELIVQPKVKDIVVVFQMKSIL